MRQRDYERYLRQSNAYDAEAKLEGWALFTDDDGALRILKLDDPDEFDAQLRWDDDDDAVAFVRLRAEDGSIPHRAALALHNPPPETDSLSMSDIIVERIFPSGAWLCAAIVNSERVHKEYMGYTKREAIRRFYDEYKDGGAS